MRKKIISLALITGLLLTSFSGVFAVVVDNSGIQNNYGVPYEPEQLGDFIASGFVYSQEPFVDMKAADKGLIPTAMKNTYDSPSTWSIDEVLEASKMGLNNMEIITGYQKNITRAEFAKLLVQAYFKYVGTKNVHPNRVLPVKMEMDIFKDIANIKNKDLITYAYYLDITQGTGDRNFSPNKNITRQEIAVMFYRFIQIFDNSITYNYNVTNNFADDKDIAGWALKEVRTLANREIIKGVGYNKFAPLDNTTKEQSLLLLLRVARIFIDPQVTNDLGKALEPKLNGTSLTWNAVNSAQYYVVYTKKYKSDTAYDVLETKRTNTNELDLSYLNGYSGKYEFAVQAFNEFDESAVADLNGSVYVPDAVKASTITYSNPFVKWTAANNADKYAVAVYKVGGGIAVNAQVVNTNQINISGLPNGQYTVVIKSINIAHGDPGFMSAETTQTIVKP